MMQLSIEVLASQIDTFLDAYQKSDFPTTTTPINLLVLVPHINGKPYTTVMDACKKLIDHGFNAVPHFAVRNITSADNLTEIQQFFATQINAILLLGGDNDKPQIFDNVLEFMNSQWGNQDTLPVNKVYFAIFPEAHPHAEGQETSILEEKINWIREKGGACGGFSQICLDAQPIITQNQRSAKNDFDFYISFVAPCKISQLLKLTAISGVKNAMSFLKKHNIYKMFKSYDSDTLIQELQNNHTSETTIKGLHCYAFGNYQGALQKLKKYAN